MKLALVLSGGGARAAYQVGVIKYLSDAFGDRFTPNIFCGTSAGAINAVFLAQHVSNLRVGANELANLWGNLSVGEVYSLNDIKLSHLGFRIALNFAVGRGWKWIGNIRSVFDTNPLRQLLTRILDMEKIHANVSNGVIDAITVTATEYGTGKAIIFVESNNKSLHWKRVQRESRQEQLSVEHILASASIPLVFPSVNLNGIYYGDGSMRDTSPFSPPAKLGADKILAIGIRSVEAHIGMPATEYPSIASIGGTIADSIFIDALDADFENLSRINRILSHGQIAHYKPIEAFFIRPTSDLGAPALGYVDEIPPMLKRVFQTFGQSNASSSDFLSYLLFAGGYAKQLIHMGYEDGRRLHDSIERFLQDEESTTFVA